MIYSNTYPLRIEYWANLKGKSFPNIEYFLSFTPIQYSNIGWCFWIKQTLFWYQQTYFHMKLIEFKFCQWDVFFLLKKNFIYSSANVWNNHRNKCKKCFVSCKTKTFLDMINIRSKKVTRRIIVSRYCQK